MSVNLSVAPVDKCLATELVVAHHYMHRRPNISFAFGLFEGECCVGVCTFGTPASREMQFGACPKDPGAVIELNRLWVADALPKNSESWFVSRALAALPPFIVVSYADTAYGHFGYVYRALNFYYAGWTDMDRKTARFDYITPGKHSRDAFRNGEKRFAERVRRSPKVKYWTLTGNRRERAALLALCVLPIMSWRSSPPPSVHRQHEAFRSARGGDSQCK